MNRDERRLAIYFTLLVAALLTLGGILLRGYVAKTLVADAKVQTAFLDLALRDRSRYLADTLQPLREQGRWPATSSYVANSPDLTKNTLADRSFINQVAYSYSTPNQAIAGTNDGNVWLGFNMGLGTAGSATWVNLTNGNAILPNRPVMDVVTDAADPLIGYAAIGGFDQNTPMTPGHIFRYVCSANCASFTWRDISGNLPNIPANTVMTNPNRLNQLFVGTDWGLYFTDDVTATPVIWRKHSGMPNVMIWDLTIDRGATTLAVWTRSRGAWAAPLPLQPNSDAIFSDGFEI